MRKIIYLTLVVLCFALIIISGCSNSSNLTGKSNNPTGNAVQGNSQNNNVEQTTTTQTPSCTDECSSDSCEGNNFISCETQSNGCKDSINKGEVKGQCGILCEHDSDCSSYEKCSNNNCMDVSCSCGEVKSHKCEHYECCSNSDCGSDEKCTSHECVKVQECTDECSSYECTGYEYFTCEMQSDGCTDKVNKGIVKGSCGVECLNTSDCSSNEECGDYKCVNEGYCGDGICNNNENVASCPQDCTNPIIISITDSLGNINPNSWAKGTGGDWPLDMRSNGSAIYCDNCIIKIGDKITFTIKVDKPKEEIVEYSCYSPTGPVIKVWNSTSDTETCEWNVAEQDYGVDSVVLLGIKNQDGLNYMSGENGDDYTYAIYKVTN